MSGASALLSAASFPVSRMPHSSASQPYARGPVGPESKKLDGEVARVAAENNWDKYRKKAGIGTYTLGGFICILPKFGPLMAAIKGPTAATEADYVRSVNLSTDALSAAMARLVKPHQTLANRDRYTGSPVRPGGYRLTDDTYAKLLHRLVDDPHHRSSRSEGRHPELLRPPEGSH